MGHDVTDVFPDLAVLSRMARILVVDDVEAVCRTTRRLLESAGHQVSATSEGAEAIRFIEKSPPDLVITDLHMPGMDGFELLKRLRAAGSSPKVIVISGSAEVELFQMATAMGAAGTLQKPFTREELLAAVEAAA